MSYWMAVNGQVIFDPDVPDQNCSTCSYPLLDGWCSKCDAAGDESVLSPL